MRWLRTAEEGVEARYHRMVRGWWLLLWYGLAALILAFPVLLAFADARYRGAPLFFGTDESHYVVRLQEGLLQPFADTSNGIFSSPAVHGLQPAGLEMLFGTAFGWTGWSGTTVMILLSVLFAASLVPLLLSFLRQVGATPMVALVGAWGYFLVFLGVMRRFVHQSWSLPLTVVALLCLVRFWREPTDRRAVMAGVLLGVLPHAYLWSWTFAWTVAGVGCCLLWGTGMLRRPWRHLTLLIAGVLALAVPYFWQMVGNMASPIAREVAERSSVIYARGVESPTRSVLLFLLAVSAIVSLWPRRRESWALPLLTLLLAPVIVLHQQFLHGQVISFSTHYYPYVCLVSVAALAALLSQSRARRDWPLLLLSSLFLAAALWDYSGRSLLPQDRFFQFQALAPAYELLRQDPAREVFLTDRETALFIAANTHHDVVFTEHARHLLISTREYAERHCLSEVFSPQDQAMFIPDILREPSRLGREREAQMYEERTAIAREACAWVRSHIAEALDRYGVTALLWNQVARPEWVVDDTQFILQKRGDGWSLWKRR